MVAEMVKNLPAVQEIWVQTLGQEDPLEKEMATYSSNLAWGIPRTEEPGYVMLMAPTQGEHFETHWASSGTSG